MLKVLLCVGSVREQGQTKCSVHGRTGKMKLKPQTPPFAQSSAICQLPHTRACSHQSLSLSFSPSLSPSPVKRSLLVEKGPCRDRASKLARASLTQTDRLGDAFTCRAVVHLQQRSRTLKHLHCLDICHRLGPASQHKTLRINPLQ